MDAKVRAVLDVYEERIRAESESRRETPGTSFPVDRDQRLLAVGPETGRLINILARSLEKPTILELGTSYGYSGIWLAEAARAAGGRVITMELQDYKARYAREMAQKAGLVDFIDFQVGNALDMIGQMPHGIDFVLLDLWKDLLVDCLDAFYPKLNSGAIIVADNMIFPAAAAADALRYRQAVRARPKMSSLLVPVGSGLEIRFDCQV